MCFLFAPQGTIRDCDSRRQSRGAAVDDVQCAGSGRSAGGRAYLCLDAERFQLGGVQPQPQPRAVWLDLASQGRVSTLEQINQLRRRDGMYVCS
jgi:hypothetical protein